ncbi:TRAF family member-associated NF-kappa-B activator isoform X2 [Mixophyes fleayi]|uniref:TRAF family member-associated NF-kappa-B activator isoform X2 n=1 Tax=Mixophyes fleayi TaxID=3061075 RepID=UPI003F4DA227
MDKNTGDQLNRAYEAFRQACIDKENVKKELQQKTDFYEQQLLDQHQQIVNLKSCISLLTSRLSSSFAGTGGAPFPPMSPKLENTDGCKSESASNLSIEQLQEQLKASLQREKNCKEQLQMEKIRFLEMEEKRDHLEYSQQEEIQHLKNLLKGTNERRDSRPAHEKEMRCANLIQEPSAAASDLNESSRQGVERIFSDLKEEFNRICKLTREQSSQLNTFFKKEIASDNHIPFQFSMPVQCTDEENEEVQTLQKSNDKTVRARFAPITPRGLGPDDELSTSVESLSTFSVKFPPSNSESEFLKSSTENLPVLVPASGEHMNGTKINTEVPTHLKNFNAARCSPPYSPHSPKAVCHLDNSKLVGLENNYRDILETEAEDSGHFIPAKSPVGTCTNTFCIPDIPDVDEFTGVTERTVRGPQRPVWQPLPHQGDDLSVPSGDKWDQNSSDVCEFCQAIFPPSTRSGEEFLRHLNTHFYEKL